MFEVTKDFKANEEGGTLVFVGVCLAALLGFAALTFDLGRVAATQSDLQAFADHMALAVAGELDGNFDAIDRATAAADQLIDDQQVFGLGAQALGETTDYTLRFLSGLPDRDLAYNDPTDDLASFVTADPLEATLVEVTTRPTKVFLPFFRAFGVLTGRDVDDATTTARAVAGYTQWACDIATLMFCLPENFSSASAKGTTMLLRTGSQNAAWGPGDFGFLDPSQNAIDPNGPCASLTGVAQDTCLLASSGNRTRCFAQRGVDLEPGQKVGIENAVFNTRFDMYNGTMSKNRGNPIYAPAPHRITGLVSASGGKNDTGNGGDNGNGNQCLGNNTELSAESMAFPPDTCHGTGTCDRFGDGEWDRDIYIETNYGLDPDLATASGGKFEDASSRFEYYLKEIADAAPDGRILPASNPDSTTDAQMCSTVAPSENPYRRVFIAAGIDCAENNIQGSAENVPVEEYFEVFLIRPVGDGSGSSGATNTFDMYVEVIGSAGGDGSGDADDGGIFRTVVELYR